MVKRYEPHLKEVRGEDPTATMLEWVNGDWVEFGDYDALAAQLAEAKAALAECALVRDNWCNEYTKARDEIAVARKFFDRIPAHAGIAKSNYMTTLEDLDQLRRKAYKAEAALREIIGDTSRDPWTIAREALGLTSETGVAKSE